LRDRPRVGHPGRFDDHAIEGHLGALTALGTSEADRALILGGNFDRLFAR